ncbi:MAG TPA: hypothetical protein VFH73_08510 [Polyangia bacterium]|jgi:hypothetical protein|nr:hypothetical protein [Polyangia bacterium]
MRLLLGAVTAAACLALPGAALAQLQTCVEIEGAKGDGAALARLVGSELDRHATHHAAVGNCQAYLTVEVVDLGAQEGKWLTGRINTQVPHRERIGSDGLVAAVERLLTVVLASDPLVLRGPESNAWLKRQGSALEQRSVLHFGAEVYQLGVPVGSSLETLPGLALALRREVSALHVGVRLGGALDLGNAPDRLRLRAQVDAQIEATLYATPAANTSLFAGALAGLVYQRFAGPAPLDGPGDTGTAAAWGLSLGLRAGVETMRTSDVRLVAFLQLQAPAFVSQDPDHGVVDQWTPTAAVGAGVLF